MKLFKETPFNPYTKSLNCTAYFGINVSLCNSLLLFCLLFQYYLEQRSKNCMLCFSLFILGFGVLQSTYVWTGLANIATNETNAICNWDLNMLVLYGASFIVFYISLIVYTTDSRKCSMLFLLLFCVSDIGGSVMQSVMHVFFLLSFLF